MSEHCVICGMEIPEGRQVCPICECKAGKAVPGTMSDAEAIKECRKLLGVIIEYAARQGGLWVWMSKRDPRLYRALQGLHYRRNQVPTTLTLIKGLDAAGYKLEVVPK